MADSIVYVKRYDPAPDDERFAVNEREVWRYSGYPGVPGEQETALRGAYAQVLSAMQGAFSYKVCWRRVDVEWAGESCRLPFEADSKALAACLKGCTQAVMFAATVGLETDRRIARYQRTDPTKALLTQAYGAERVERLCDAFCGELRDQLAAEGLGCTPRFSPGYGDFALAHQKDFFRLLDCSRQIGISLNGSLLMTPSKSVTAIFGIGKNIRGNNGAAGCAGCGKADCAYCQRETTQISR